VRIRCSLRPSCRCRGHLHLIIPCDNYESTFDDDNHRQAYRRLLSAATSIERLDFPEPSEVAFFEAGKRVADRCDLLLAVWDGEKARGLGGSGDVVAIRPRSEQGRRDHLACWRQALMDRVLRPGLPGRRTTTDGLVVTVEVTLS
jgi:hypothetical protein